MGTPGSAPGLGLLLPRQADLTYREGNLFYGSASAGRAPNLTA